MKRYLVTLALVLVVGLILFPTEGKTQMGPGMMGQGRMGPGMMGGMGSSMMPLAGMAGCERMGLMGMLHQWGSYLFAQKDKLGLTEVQLDKIDSILNSHIKYAIRKNADRKILLIEIQELLVKDTIDLGQAETKVRAIGAVNVDMNIEGIRTLEKALSVMTAEQRKKAKALFRESTYTRALRMRSLQGAMMGRGMMGQGGMMMGPGMMQGMMGPGMMGQQGAVEEAKAAPLSPTQTNSGGGVTVAVTYVDAEQKAGKAELVLKVKMDTHTVELGQYELEELSVLRNDRGDVVEPLRWETLTPTGHHVLGSLIFPNRAPSGRSIIDTDTKYLELVIRNIAGVAERDFRWDLRF